MNFNFLNILILLGAIQGFIVSVLLFFSTRSSQQANRLLAVLILTIALACFNLYLHESGLYSHYQLVLLIVELLPFILAMAFGPLIYFYVKSVIDPTFRFDKKCRIHFVPIIIDLIPHLIVWYFFAGMLIGVFTNKSGAGWGDIIDEYNAYADIPRWLSISVYVWFARKKLINSKSIDPADYKWLSLFLKVFIAFQALWFLFLIPYIMPQFRYPLLDLTGWYLLYIPLVVIIYWLGIKGYFQLTSVPPKRNIALVSISSNTIEKTIALLNNAMQVEKLYLDSSLTVSSLGVHLKIPQKTISSVLNQHLNSSFNEFVNQYRVHEVKGKLLAQEYKHLTITGIAFECGFNSQATFQRAFKQITNLSPSEFVASQSVLIE